MVISHGCSAFVILDNHFWKENVESLCMQPKGYIWQKPLHAWANATEMTMLRLKYLDFCRATIHMLNFVIYMRIMIFKLMLIGFSNPKPIWMDNVWVYTVVWRWGKFYFCCKVWFMYARSQLHFLIEPQLQLPYLDLQTARPRKHPINKSALYLQWNGQVCAY